MARIYIFGDEAGNFDFSRTKGASKYFILTTVTMEDCRQLESDLLALRRELQWQREDLDGAFHCTHDRQAVRNEVFNIITNHTFRIDVTIFEKSKTKPHLTGNNRLFYKTLWFYHLKNVAPNIAGAKDEVLLVAASLSKKVAAQSVLKDVVLQTATARTAKAAFWPAETEPCLQVADYCCWAIQRKWERSDDRSYQLISKHIQTEFDMFAGSKTHHY